MQDSNLYSTHFNTRHTATHRNTLQHTAHCSTLQHISTHCTLQHTATQDLNRVCCSLLQYATLRTTCVAVCCSDPHCSVPHCNTLQHTATHCNTPQHTRFGTSSHTHTLSVLLFFSLAGFPPPRIHAHALSHPPPPLAHPSLPLARLLSASLSAKNQA